MALSDKLLKQLEFIKVTDQLKSIHRKTSPINHERKENSAEHSWQVMLTSIILAEHSNEKIDLLKVLKMLAVHDVVEIDVGDTFHFHKSLDPDLHNKELAAAKRILGILPKEQGEELLDLWNEFEAKETKESKFANSVDRLMAFIMNSNNNGGTWAEYNLELEQVLNKNSEIKNGSDNLWELAQALASNFYSK